MLVSVFRNGPLRHRLYKGYVVCAGDPAAVVRDVLRRPPRLPALLSLRGSAARPGGVWIDTGAVWLSDPAHRWELLRSLAEATAALAAAIDRLGGALVPAAARAASADRVSWLCEDRHAVEVANEIQRELVANLFRRYVPELIALTGRAAFGDRGAEERGSRRLAETRDQVPARFLASASPRHLRRVEEELRRDDRVSGLDVMDVSPLGDSALGVPNVELRCIDAQAFPAHALAHAILVQAIAVKARKLERAGRRLPAMHQGMLDRNRSRAIAQGRAARLELERGPREERSAPARTRSAEVLLEELIRELVPELRAMEVTADELMPLAGGLSLRGEHPGAIRTENDLFALWWSRREAALDARGLHQTLSDPHRLIADQITMTNGRLSPGGTLTVRDHWARVLRGEPPAAAKPATKPRTAPSRHAPSRHAPSRPADDREVVAALSAAGDREQSLSAVREHLRRGGRDNLTSALAGLDRETAKEVRRKLRGPAAAVLRPRDLAGLDAALAADVAARDDAVIALDAPISQRPDALGAVREFGRQLPAGVRHVLFSNNSYKGPNGQRVSIEVLVLGRAGR